MPCTAMQKMLRSSNPSAAFQSICSWKLLLFSLPSLVSCHSRSHPLPLPGWILLPQFPCPMSDSFHLTKSLLCHVSPVSLHLCQGPFHMSEHFSDIWCWDRGRETQTQHHPQNAWEGPGRQLGGEGGTWSLTLEEAGPAQCSALLSPFPQSVTQRKRHFLRVKKG